MVWGFETISMSQLTVNEPRGNKTFTSASDPFEIKWGIGFNTTCASPVEFVHLSISYDNQTTWNTISADTVNLILSGSGTNLFTDTSGLGHFTSASWPTGPGDGSNSYVRVIEVISGTTTGNNNTSAYSDKFTVI